MDTFQVKLALLKHAMNPRTLAALLAGGGLAAYGLQKMKEDEKPNYVGALLRGVGGAVSGHLAGGALGGTTVGLLDRYLSGKKHVDIDAIIEGTKAGAPFGTLAGLGAAYTGVVPGSLLDTLIKSVGGGSIGYAGATALEKLIGHQNNYLSIPASIAGAALGALHKD